MSEEEDISLKDIKHCAKCGSNVRVSNIGSIATVTCQSDSTRCDFKVTAHDFESRLLTCAKRGSMKFCYFCGGDMENVDDFLVCGSCTDSINFKVAGEEEIMIVASELKYCIMCAVEVKVSESSRKMICSRAKCKFRILDMDSSTVTKSLHEYSANGKIKFCYACGLKTSDDGNYNKCINDSCGSTPLPSGPIVRGKPTSDSSDQRQKSNGTELTLHEAVAVMTSPARPTWPPKCNDAKLTPHKAVTMASAKRPTWPPKCNDTKLTPLDTVTMASAERPTYTWPPKYNDAKLTPHEAVTMASAKRPTWPPKCNDTKLTPHEAVTMASAKRPTWPPKCNDAKLSPHKAVTMAAAERPTWSPKCNDTKSTYPSSARPTVLPKSKQVITKEGENDITKHRKAVEHQNGTSEQQNSLASTMRTVKDAWSSIERTLSASKSRQVYRLVLIGETGSGKTSFYNLLCNFNIVCDLGLEQSLDKLRNFHDLKLESAHHNPMESKTSDATAYKLTVDDLEVGIIDTPGFGDSRGIEEDRKNIKKIIDTLEREEYVNCICLVINGRLSRATSHLQYVLSEISGTLPKTAFKNLTIIMTNCGDVTCCNFSLNELPSFFGSEEVINPNRVFYIDNPCSKLEKCRNEALVATPEQLVKALSSSFQMTGETLVKMLDTIKDFREIHTNCFVELYSTKEKVEKDMLLLLKADENTQELKQKISRIKDKLDAAVRTKTLNRNFQTTMKVKKVVQLKTKEHNTICGAPHCNSNCHVPCSLPKTVDKENIKQCDCINRKNDFICNVCGHSFEQHFHAEIVYKIREEEEIITDTVLQRMFDDAKSQEQLCSALKTECDMKLKECEKEMEDLCAILTCSIKSFEALGSSPSYRKMIECQIFVLDQVILSYRKDKKDVKQLKKAKTDLERQLQVVNKVTCSEGKARKK